MKTNVSTSLKALMALPLFVGIIAGAFVFRGNARAYHQTAAKYGQAEKLLMSLSIEYPDGTDAATEVGAMLAYYRSLRVKYEVAASRPWILVAPDPPPPDIRYCATYWMERNDFRRAIATYDEMIARELMCAADYNGRAWIYATCPEAKYRSAKLAVESALLACELDDWSNPAFLDTLAAANAEARDFSEAIRWEKEAMRRVGPNSADWREFRERLMLYQRRKPYHGGSD